ncbi:hypothetical protein V8D89_005034 [Ganoderma adspersum]
MNATSTATLQHYTPGLHSVLTNVVMSALLLGSLTVLSTVSVGHLIRRGVKQPSTAFMLGGVLILYASSVTHFGLALSYSVEYVRLLNNSAAALTATSTIHAGSVQLRHSARTTSYILNFVLAVNVTLGDALVWWRVCFLWRKKSIIALGVVFITGTFDEFYVQPHVDLQPLRSYDDVYGGISGLLSMVTNVTATSLIGIKAWDHREVLRQGPGSARGRWNTPTMRVLMLLVESGAAYCIILGIALTNNIVSRSESASRTPSGAAFVSVTTAFLSGCFVPVLAIYPTVIIVIVAVNWSLIDNTLADCYTSGGPSRIPSDLLSSALFRNSSVTVSIPLNEVHRDWHGSRDGSAFPLDGTSGGSHSCTQG